MTRSGAGADATRRRLRRALAVGSAGAAILAPPAPHGALAQEPRGPARVVAALERDSIRVGEPFVLGVTVRAGEASEVRFPPILPVTDPLEQSGAVRVRSDAESGEWRAYYTLLAWRAESLEIPPFEVEVVDAGGRARALPVPLPVVRVSSVLPDPDDELALREARPFLRLSRPWWPWIAAALALLGLGAWWWLRRRRSGAVSEPTGAPLDPWARALLELERLRAGWAAGRLSGLELYDRFEATFREFARVTRAWAPGRPLRELANGDGELAGAFRRSALVRFARLRPRDETPLLAVAAATAFVRRERAAKAAAANVAPAATTEAAATRGGAGAVGSGGR